MARNNQKNNLNKQKRDRISRLFQNSVGVTASATAVVVATPLFDNVNAEFNEFKLLEDSIYYELEVIDESAEENASYRPLRLVIENQWERIEVDLEYGVTEDVLNDLRPNANYSFTVQMDKGVTWVTLASESVTTEDELAGVIGPVRFTENDMDFKTQVDLYTQSGGSDIQFYQLSIVKDNLSLDQIVLDEGETTIDFSLIKDNSSYTLQLQAITTNNQLILLDEKVVHVPAHFDASLSVELINPTQALLKPKTDLDSFSDTVYTISVFENGALISENDGSDDYVLNLSTDSDYVFIFTVTYTDDRTNETFSKTLNEIELETPADLFYVLNIIDNGITRDYLLTVENFDEWFTKAEFRLGVNSSEFQRISTVGTSTLLRFQTPSAGAEMSFNIVLVMNSSSESELIIYP